MLGFRLVVPQYDNMMEIVAVGMAGPFEADQRGTPVGFVMIVGGTCNPFPCPPDQSIFSARGLFPSLPALFHASQASSGLPAFGQLHKLPPYRGFRHDRIGVRNGQVGAHTFRVICDYKEVIRAEEGI